MHDISISYVSKKTLKERLGGLSDATIHRWVKAGILPQPRQIGPNRIAWITQELDLALANFPVAEGKMVAPGARRGRKPRNLSSAEG